MIGETLVSTDCTGTSFENWLYLRWHHQKARRAKNWEVLQLLGVLFNTGGGSLKNHGRKKLWEKKLWAKKRGGDLLKVI